MANIWLNVGCCGSAFVVWQDCSGSNSITVRVTLSFGAQNVLDVQTGRHNNSLSLWLKQ